MRIWSVFCEGKPASKNWFGYNSVLITRLYLLHASDSIYFMGNIEPLNPLYNQIWWNTLSQWRLSLVAFNLSKTNEKYFVHFCQGNFSGFCCLTDYSTSHWLVSNSPLLLQSDGCPVPAFLICVQRNPFWQSRNHKRECCTTWVAGSFIPTTSLALNLLLWNKGQAPTAAPLKLSSWCYTMSLVMSPLC